MQRLSKHLRIGLRWLTGGWRLFTLNPWLLGGMGLTTVALIGVLALIPLLGGLLIALLSPIWLSSAYLAIDGVQRQPRVLPASLRATALKQSPWQIISVFRNEAHVLPTAVACMYCAAAVLLTNLPVQALAGNAWVADWSSLDHGAQAGVLVAMLLVFTLYVVLAASLIYALPLTFLRDEPLIPSVRQSLRASRHFVIALLVLLGALLAPLLLGAIASWFALWLGYLVWLVTGSVILPVITASLYRSYRDIFDIKDYQSAIDTRQPADRRMANAGAARR